jgi:hypothetical protein
MKTSTAEPSVTVAAVAKVYPPRKAYIRVQKKKQERDRIFGQHDKGYKSAIAGVRRTEELYLGKQRHGDKDVGEPGNAERSAEKMPSLPRYHNILCGTH